MSARRKKTYRYSFDSKGNFLGRTEVNMGELYVRRGVAALVLLIGLSFFIGQGCRMMTQTYNPRPQLSAPQIQLPL